MDVVEGGEAGGEFGGEAGGEGGGDGVESVGCGKHDCVALVRYCERLMMGMGGGGADL